MKLDADKIISKAKLTTPLSISPGEYIARYLETAVREAVRQINEAMEANDGD